MIPANGNQVLARLSKRGTRRGPGEIADNVNPGVTTGATPPPPPPLVKWCDSSRIEKAIESTMTYRTGLDGLGIAGSRHGPADQLT